MLKKQIFILSHFLYDNNFLSLYNEYIDNQWKSIEELEYQQERQLKVLLMNCYINVPFYTSLFNSLGLHPNDINKIEDLKYIPILTKEIIKDNWENFKPVNLGKIRHHTNATGGTTGTPMRYRVSKEQRTRMLATLYRGWGYGGYNLSDALLYFGGTSIGVGKEFNLKKSLQNFTRNIIAISAYDLDNTKLSLYIKKLNAEKPEYIRSFPSAIYFLAKWIKQNNVDVHIPKAIFTTSEKLYPEMRYYIESVFQTKIYDNYGLNDGGLSAYECSKHLGMHIDYENSIFEVIDDQKNVTNGEGKAIATSLYNYSFPFLRYETGDIVKITDKPCSCGRKTKLITEIISRSVDFFITTNKRYIHGWFFYIIMESHSVGIDKYQIVQKDYNLIHINLVINNEYNKETGLDIIKLIKEKESSWEIKINYLDAIETTKSGKFKFIYNELLLNE